MYIKDRRPNSNYEKFQIIKTNLTEVNISSDMDLANMDILLTSLSTLLLHQKHLGNHFRS